MPTEGMPISHWMPIIIVALFIAVAGAVVAFGSVRLGQYRDPERAKFRMLDGDHDDYPADEPGR